jgi:hypothetical protein
MTALEGLINILDNNRNWSADFIFDTIDNLLEKERQQIIDAYIQGDEDGYHSIVSQSDYEIEGRSEYLGEKYYNETFNK